MFREKNERNAPSWGSKIISAFRGSGNDARLAALERYVMAKFDALETELSDLQANQAVMASRVSAAAAAFNALRVAVADLKRQIAEMGNDDAKIAELAAAFDAIDKAGDETAAALDSATNSGPTSSTGGM